MLRKWFSLRYSMVRGTLTSPMGASPIIVSNAETPAGQMGPASVLVRSNVGRLHMKQSYSAGWLFLSFPWFGISALSCFRPASHGVPTDVYK